MCCFTCRRDEEIAGAVAGGYSRDTSTTTNAVAHDADAVVLVLAESHCRRDEKIAGAVAGGYARDTSALRPEASLAKRSGDMLSEGFTKPKKFKT